MLVDSDDSLILFKLATNQVAKNTRRIRREPVPGALKFLLELLRNKRQANHLTVRMHERSARTFTAVFEYLNVANTISLTQNADTITVGKEHEPHLQIGQFRKRCGVRWRLDNHFVNATRRG